MAEEFKLPTLEQVKARREAIGVEDKTLAKLQKALEQQDEAKAELAKQQQPEGK